MADLKKMTLAEAQEWADGYLPLPANPDVDAEACVVLAAALIESQAALAAATEEQSRAWALLTGEKWTQTRPEGSLLAAAERVVAQLAAATNGIHAACGNRHGDGACILETVALVRERTAERDEALSKLAALTAEHAHLLKHRDMQEVTHQRGLSTISEAYRERDEAKEAAQNWKRQFNSVVKQRNEAQRNSRAACDEGRATLSAMMKVVTERDALRAELRAAEEAREVADRDAEHYQTDRNVLALRCDALRADRDDLQATFDLRHAADRRAIDQWHAAGNDALTWPDHADLVVWLAEQAESLRRERDDYKEQARQAVMTRSDLDAAKEAVMASGTTIGRLRESVRDLVDGLTALLLVLPDGPTRCPACNCSWSDREIAKMRDDRAGACWCGKWAFDIDTLLAKHAAPAPTSADAKEDDRG